ncbi:MAG TPA: GAF domain-containing protein [Longimicrobium sp.]|nr:GAF domain-containing protein [Longimicrobium sp.]
MKRSPSGASAAASGSLRDQLDRCHAELVRERRSLHAAEQANRALAEAHAELVERYAVLTRLYAAAGMLHDAADEAAALRALAQVMVNLAGTEDFGIYQAGPGGDLTLLHSFGPRAQRFSRLAPAGAVARALEHGTAWAADAPHATDPDGGPVACIPLRLGDRAAGAVVVWSFLPQKHAFEPFDVELFALLTDRAAPAIRVARLLEGAS